MMKINTSALLPATLVALLALGCTRNPRAPHPDDLMLRYHTPATCWEETLPLGNGRLGMMPDGGVEHEHIVLNDITMWSGSKDTEVFDPKARRTLPLVQGLLFHGENLEAQELMYAHFRCGGQGSAFGAAKDAPYGCYQMLADMHIRHSYADNTPHTAYERTLLLNEALAQTRFTKGGVAYERQYLASYTGDVLLIRLAADKRQQIGFTLALTRPERAQVNATPEGDLLLHGQLNDGYNTQRGVRFQARARVVHRGGTQSTSDSTITLQGADEALIIISAATNMRNSNYEDTVRTLLDKAARIPFKTQRRKHAKAFRQRFDRVALNLGAQTDSIPTDERLRRFQQHPDPAFAALYFQYGRYLMLSGTRENSLPLNLQGLWANQLQTPWNADYHLNINLQMNYWPTEAANLSELHKPLIRLVADLVPSGERTAEHFYNADGWVVHMMTNPWLFTAPGEDASWGSSNIGGAWLCAHLWQHYIYNNDTSYLRSVFPIMQEAANFFTSSMITDPIHRWFVTAPSSSPENAFYLPHAPRKPVFVCMGSTMDAMIVGELFDNLMAAAKVLGIQNDQIFRAAKKSHRLPPLRISPTGGYLMEWMEDYEEVDPQHRHISHLYGLFPGNRISPHRTPQLAEAARRSLIRRGDGGTGWARAWKINLWARLADGKKAHELLQRLLQPATDTDGGTYPNLFCAHPPFQIDGNLGGTSGIIEMLLQCHTKEIRLLPALPDEWHTGSFRGLCVPGGAEVDATWKNKQLQTLTLRAKTDNNFVIALPENASVAETTGEYTPAEHHRIVVAPGKGNEITLQFKYV